MRNKQKCIIILISYYIINKKENYKNVHKIKCPIFSVKQIMLYSLNGILYSTLQTDNTDLHLFNEYLYYMNKAN